MRLALAMVLGASLIAASAMHRYKAYPLESDKLEVGGLHTAYVVVDGFTGQAWVCFGVTSACHRADGAGK